MKVQELIDYLKKCHPDYDVFVNDCHISGIEEKTDMIQPETNNVNIWT